MPDGSVHGGTSLERRRGGAGRLGHGEEDGESEPLLSLSHDAGGDGAGSKFVEILDLSDDPSAAAALAEVLQGNTAGIPVLIDEMNRHGTEYAQSYHLTQSSSTWGGEVNLGGGGRRRTQRRQLVRLLRRAASSPGRRSLDHDQLDRPDALSSHRKLREGLAAALAATGILAAGCGSGSSSPFTGTFHAPAGYVAYHGNGYVVAVPAHFVAKPGTVGNQPPGSTVVEVTNGGNPAAKAQSEILLLENPHLTFSLDEVVDNLSRADRTNTSVSNTQISAAKATVPGARDARIVTESYVAPDSPSNPRPTTFDRKWLMVLIKPGLLLDVVVANAPKLGGHIDADAVIDSFRLEQ